MILMTPILMIQKKKLKLEGLTQELEMNQKESQ